jgi:hypothetical protein
MNWFEKFCRNLGLAVHNIRHPDDKERRVIRREVHEENRGDVTLRRTTIEEIEISRKDTTDGS